MGRFLRPALVGICAAVWFALATVPASAAATTQPVAPATAVSAGAQAQAVVYHLVTPYGTVTYGWRPFTAQERVLLRADSASGCSEDVCITIIGDGAYVSDWYTHAYWNGGYICSHSFWWINDHLWRTGNGVCGGAGVFFSDWPAKRNFPTPSLACNTWQVIPGRPCESITR